MRAKKAGYPLIISRLPREIGSEFQTVEQLARTEEHLAKLITDALAEGLNTEDTAALDQRIIKQTETLGWRIFLSPAVLIRLQAWETEPRGSLLYERLGGALGKYGRIMHRLELPSIDPAIKTAKPQFTDELRLAFRSIKADLAKQKKPSDTAKLLQCFDRVLAGGDFPYLMGNLESWRYFIVQESGFVFEQLNAPRLAPATLFDAWISWATGYEQETLRQKISAVKL